MNSKCSPSHYRSALQCLYDNWEVMQLQEVMALNPSGCWAFCSLFGSSHSYILAQVPSQEHRYLLTATALLLSLGVIMPNSNMTNQQSLLPKCYEEIFFSYNQFTMGLNLSLSDG